MSVILVLEQDAGYAGRISSVLRAAGHEVHVVQNLDHALQIAAARPPQLLLASGSNAGAADLLDRFARRRGGPGSVVLLPSTLAEQVQAADYRADEILTKPFTESDLHAMARRFLTASPAPQPSAAQKNQLTSADIFGDVLAEVEAEAQKSAASRRAASRDDVNKKLEETLAGVFPMTDRPRPSAPAAASGAAPQVLPSAAPTAPQRPATPFPQPGAPPFPQQGGPPQLGAPQPTLQRPPHAMPPQVGPPPAAAPMAGPPAQRPTAPAGMPPGLAAALPPGMSADGSRPPTGQVPLAAGPAGEAPRRARPLPPSADEIDDLLDKTLSSLELPRQRRPAPPTGPPPAAAPAPPSSPFAVPPTSAPGLVQAPPGMTPPPRPAPSPVFSPPAAEPPPAAARPAVGLPPGSVAPAATPRPAEVATQPPMFAPLPSFEAAPFPSFDQPPSFDPAPSFDRAPTFDSAPSFEPIAAFEPAPAIPQPAPFEPFAAMSGFPGASPASSPPAADPWGGDLWPASGGFDASAPAAPSKPVSPGAAAAPWLPNTESFPKLEMTPQQAPPSWEPPPAWEPVAGADDTGWSVSSFEDLPTPKLSSIPDLADPSASGDAPADFLSAFAPPSETGSFVKPLPRPREDSQQRVSTSDFGLPQEADPGWQAALDGVLQIRGGHQTGRPEGDLEGSPFGDYRLMERVAIGGMAEVWRARRRGVEGFQKTVAIKKILSHLTGSVDFVTMFIDEAKLAAQLSHNNIIQIYDLGKVDDDFYIAMEYVEGWDLRSILNSGRERGLPLPLPLALAICAAVARALDYAHRKRDFSNRALGLVHRDVSPQNVMISREGEIKLCDFGIVKAVSKASTTQMGALKGKLQYMSPEQAWGREVDARSDIFSLGSVLFEVLTGTKLFTGDSEIGVLDAVRDCRIRSPREIVPSIPEEVERIVFRSLAKNPEDRYQTAGQLEKDLTAVLDSLRLTPGQRDMAEYLQLLFNTPLLRHEPRPAPSFPPPAAAPSGVHSSASRAAFPAPAPAPAAKPKTALFAGIAAVVLLLLFLAWFFLLREPAPAEPDVIIPPGGEQQAPGAGTADPAAAAPEGGAPAATDGAPAAAGGNDVVRQMVNEQLDARQKEIERDFDEKRRKLEEELARVQRENQRGSRPPAGGGGGGGN